MATTITIQRNFVSNLEATVNSPKKKFREVKKFLNKAPEIASVPQLGLREEHYSFCIDTDSVSKIRYYYHATKSSNHKGRTVYEAWIEEMKIGG